MKLVTGLEERENKKERHEEIGFIYSDIEGMYWNETMAVQFTESEIDTLEEAGTYCHNLAMKAVELIIESEDDNQLLQIGIPEGLIPLVRSSWAERDKNPNLYGRFDFALTFNEKGELVPRCYEYNADTPTSLFEASIAQWQWLEDSGLNDQFNFIHESLVMAWDKVKEKLGENSRYYLTALPTREDWSTIVYLQDTALESGINHCDTIDIIDISLNHEKGLFVDNRNYSQQEKHIDVLFKLYPWEYLVNDEFFPYIEGSKTTFIEPAWKLVLSSKGLLAKMYELEPECPYLIPTKLADEDDLTVLSNLKYNLNFNKYFVNSSDSYVIKPCLSREGSGVLIVKDGKITKTESDLRNSKQHVIQDCVPSYKTEKGTIMAGVWVINDVSCGMGIRLDGDITGNNAQFIPHFF